MKWVWNIDGKSMKNMSGYLIKQDTIHFTLQMPTNFSIARDTNIGTNLENRQN
jgi:hypothetical protein